MLMAKYTLNIFQSPLRNILVCLVLEPDVPSPEDASHTLTAS